MSKKWKVFWIVTAGIAGMGLMFLILGLLFGATIEGIQRRYPHGIGIHSQQTEVLNGENYFRNIQKLNIEAGAVQVQMIPSEGDAYYVETEDISDAGFVSVYEEEGTLNVQTKKHRVFRKCHHNGVIRVYFPEDVVLTKMDLSIGAGSLYGDGIMAREIDVDCGMGEVKLNLLSSKEEYNYSIDCGMGKVEIGGDVFDGIAQREIYNGQPQDVEIECGMGNVTMNFAE